MIASISPPDFLIASPTVLSIMKRNMPKFIRGMTTLPAPAW